MLPSGEAITPKEIAGSYRRYAFTIFSYQAFSVLFVFCFCFSLMKAKADGAENWGLGFTAPVAYDDWGQLRKGFWRVLITTGSFNISQRPHRKDDLLITVIATDLRMVTDCWATIVWR
jgi:hypothetical protein